jgi:RND family efflux transporter MFP subunit
MSEGRIVLLATLPVIAGAAWLLSLRRPDATVHALRAERVQVQARESSAQSGPSEGYLGVIVAGYTADVGAEVGGRVAEVFATVGARVKSGDPLLRVDASIAGDGVRVAKARLEQQRSAVARARAELAEANDLVTRLDAIEGGVSDRAVVAARAKQEQARAALQEAEAGLGVHEADVGQQQNRSQKHVIRAPFDGVVVARFVDPGGLVTPGQIVARVITEDHYVRFAMPPEEAQAKTAGFAIEVWPPGASEPLRAVVTDIQPEVDASAQLVFLRARLDALAAKRPDVIPGVRVRVREASAAPPSGGE